MSEQQIKEYLQKYNITSKELLASHIEELKRNTKPNVRLISQLVWVLEDFFFQFFCAEKPNSANDIYKEIENFSNKINQQNETMIHNELLKEPKTQVEGLFSNLRKCSNQCFCDGSCKKPQKTLNNHVSEAIDRKLGEYTRTELEPDYRLPFFLDEVIKASEISEQKTNKEEFLIYDSPSSYRDINKFAMVELDTRNKLHCIPTDATNIEVFHLDTKDNGDKTAFIGFKIRNGNFSFVEVPFTSPKVAEKENKQQSLKTEENLVFPKDSEIHKEGIKESNGKTDYSEIDWDIIDLMAKRFNANKHKYPKNNMLKPIEKTELLFAGFRHLRKMMQPIENDEESFLEHLTAVMCNMQMIYQQRKISNG